jgi:hypothetical protein
MSTNILYHAFGLKIYEYLRTEYRNGAVFFHVRKKEGVQYYTNCQQLGCGAYRPISKGVAGFTYWDETDSDRWSYAICHFLGLSCRLSSYCR